MASESLQQSIHVTHDVLSFAAKRARRYIQQIRERKVAPAEKDVATLSRFCEAFPEAPSQPRDVLRMLDKFGSPATVATTGGRYFGFVVGGVLPAAMAANWMASAWDQPAGLRVMSPIAAELEEVVLRWICDALDLPHDCEGGLVTCATTANFTALAAARHALLAREGWNVAEDGMFGAPPIEVVVAAEAHASILKALSLAGFGRKRVTVVEADSQGRMRADKLPKLTKRAIACIQAGNVNSGAHKWLNLNYDSGIVMVRDGAVLRASMTMSAAYLEPGGRREPMYHVPEASRRARGVDLWAALKSLGRSGLCALIDRTCSHARRFAAGLRGAGFDVLNDVVINQVLVSFGPSEITRKVIRRIQEDGTCWCGTTEWQGKTAMRISVSSWVTTEADVDLSLEAIIRIARECAAHKAGTPK